MRFYRAYAYYVVERAGRTGVINKSVCALPVCLKREVGTMPGFLSHCPGAGMAIDGAAGCGRGGKSEEMK